MASASKRFDENGVLVERAISTPVEVETEVVEDLTQRPYKEPDRSTMADRYAARAKATSRTKAVDSDDTENKAVGRRGTSKK